MNLSESEKERIRAEEIFRQSLQPREERRILAFLNSNLGMWLLSSILLGSLTFIFTSSLAYFQQQQIDDLQISKLEISIKGDLETFYRDARLATTYHQFLKLYKDNFQGNSYRFLEFKGMTFYDRIWTYSILGKRKCWSGGAKFEKRRQYIDRGTELIWESIAWASVPLKTDKGIDDKLIMPENQKKNLMSGIEKIYEGCELHSFEKIN